MSEFDFDKLFEGVENSKEYIEEMKKLSIEEKLNSVVSGLTDWLNEFYDRDSYNLTANKVLKKICLLYTSPSPRDGLLSRMPSSA